MCKSAVQNFNARSVNQISNQFDQINAALDGSVTTWFMTHRPTWGLARQKDGVNTLINATLQSALRMTSAGSLPAPVTLAFGGHMHRYETLTFSDGGPPQIVIGNSGVELTTHDPKGDIAACWCLCRQSEMV